MARKVIGAAQSEAMRPLDVCLEMSGGQSAGESLEEVMKNMKEVMEIYLETLIAQEKENRLSR